MFVDTIRCGTMANGVLRIALLYRDASGADVAAGELLVPESRIASLADSFAALAEGFAPEPTL